MTLAYRVLAAVLVAAAAAPAQMQYRNAAEIEEKIGDLATRFPDNVRRKIIGSSPDYFQNSKNPPRVPIWAIRISAGQARTVEDDYRKNAILFEAGSHPREWLPIEGMLQLAEHLAANASVANSYVPRLLEKVDVWIVPLSNPAGRNRDSAGGDPNHYYRTGGGWRGNGDNRGTNDQTCERGVNVARSFSSSWSSAPATCGDDSSESDFRGNKPFQSEEAVALRNFVQNHGISMAVVVHSPFQTLFNMWGDSDVAGSAFTELALWAWNSAVDGTAIMRRQPFGRGLGQFSAWLATASDAAGEPDFGTVRAIQTIFVELPFCVKADGCVVDNTAYVSPWRHSDTDSSNRFHPSGNAIQDLISSQIRGVSNVFMSNAASPGCNLYYGCPDKDYGLVKAKIATSLLGAGKLETYGAWRDANGNWQPARDYLAIGNYAMLYRAQNFSRDAAYNDFDVRLTVQEDGSAAMSVVSTRQVRDLARTDTYDGIFAVRIPKANADYTVTLELVAPGSTAAADEFTNNNKKVFRFRSYTMQ